jgi:calcineurin-like phosphoesterase family protein
MIRDQCSLHSGVNRGELDDADDASTLRLDLKLGIPHSKVKGALEWWIGDSGLCRSPDDHPYLVVAEISAESWHTEEDVMQAISKSATESGPIQISVYSVVEQGELKNLSFYQVYPSPGLRTFILYLAQICPVIWNLGSMTDCIARGIPAPFTLISPPTPQNITFKPRKRPEDTNVHRKIHLCDDTSDGVHHQNEMKEGPVTIEILRMALRRGRKLIAEYDTIQNTWLTPTESVLRKNAISSLREFRIRNGFQMTGPHFERSKEIYIISDLHLGHSNSIPRYNRPFLRSEVNEMDRILIRNWNWTIKEKDTVIYLGDLTYRSSTPSEVYLSRLSGQICYLEGNHDPYQPYMSHCLLMRYKGVSYLFIHNPDELSDPFDGWVIHGHIHNKNLSNYPFFNPHTRTVNVSAEMIGYRPITMNEIHNLVIGVKETILFRDISFIRDINRDFCNAQIQDIHTRDYHACQV